MTDNDLPATSWRLSDTVLDVRPGALMGVVNVTPDSFSDGGVNFDPETAIASGMRMWADGAALVDVGGESTRPGADPVPADEELRRVIPVVEPLAGAGVRISIDTTKPEVAETAIRAGASVVNDVSAGSTPGMLELVADAGVGLVLMHAKGDPKTMQIDPVYYDVVAEVMDYLKSRLEVALVAGVAEERIAVDPGIGFGKTAHHNVELIGALGEIAAIGRPVVLGTSRKSFLGKLTGIEDPSDRDGVTAVTTALGFALGARVFRVHDVASSRSALDVAAAIVQPQIWEEWSQDSNPGASPG